MDWINNYSWNHDYLETIFLGFFFSFPFFSLICNTLTYPFSFPFSSPFFFLPIQWIELKKSTNENNVCQRLKSIYQHLQTIPNPENGESESSFSLLSEYKKFCEEYIKRRILNFQGKVEFQNLQVELINKLCGELKLDPKDLRAKSSNK